MEANLNGARLFYATFGRGTPVLCLHGGLGWDHTYFLPWLEPLGTHATVVLCDLRGNGRSERPNDWSGITHATWIDDVDALRVHLGFDQFVLFGHSYGGFLAQDYALRYRDHLKGLILCDTAPAFDYQTTVLANAQARATPRQLQALLDVLSAPVMDDEAFRRISLEILPIYFHRFTPAQIASIFEHTAFSAAAYNHSNRCLAQFDTLERLAEIDVPTLVLGGADDWITPPAFGAHRLHDGLPRSNLLIFEQSGHFPFIEEQKAFVREVGRWIDALD